VVIRAQFGLPSISDGMCCFETPEMALNAAVSHFRLPRLGLFHHPEEDSSVIKRPIGVKFELPTHTVSGIAVRYLNVSDAQSRNEYTCMPWIRYITSSGEYQFRMSQR
jgi:hypothetical protein